MYRKGWIEWKSLTEYKQRNTYPMASRKGHKECHDYEYELCGIFNVAFANINCWLVGGDDESKNK